MSGYNYIVIGGGSAGRVIAARLTEDPEAKLLLLEASGDGLLDVVSNPQLWPTLGGTERDWGYETVSQRGTGHVHAIPLAHRPGRWRGGTGAGPRSERHWQGSHPLTGSFPASWAGLAAARGPVKS